MKNITCALALAMTCVTVSLPLKAEKLDVTLSKPGEEAMLIIDSPFAMINVETHSGQNMIFDIQEGEESDGGRRHRNSEKPDDEKSKGMKLIPSRAGYSIEEQNNRVELEIESYKNSFTVTVQVPVNTSLKLESANAGDIRVSGVNGNHELQNANGGIFAKAIAGSLVAETANGEVEVSFTAVNADTPMAFSTVNGDVDVSFPADFAADLYIDSGRGSIYTDFDLKLKAAESPVLKQSRNGGSLVEVKKEIRGSINGGGSIIRMETFNGSVYIRASN